MKKLSLSSSQQCMETIPQIKLNRRGLVETEGGDKWNHEAGLLFIGEKDSMIKLNRMEQKREAQVLFSLQQETVSL